MGREERGGAVVFDTITAEGGAVCTSRKDLVGTMDRLARVARDSHAPLAPPTCTFAHRILFSCSRFILSFISNLGNCLYKNTFPKNS